MPNRGSSSWPSYALRRTLWTVLVRNVVVVPLRTDPGRLRQACLFSRATDTSLCATQNESGGLSAAAAFAQIEEYRRNSERKLQSHLNLSRSADGLIHNAKAAGGGRRVERRTESRETIEKQVLGNVVDRDVEARRV